MKIHIAIDSFKGSMTSLEAGQAVKRGILLAKPEAKVTVSPLVDGGEGTTDALVEGLGGEKIHLTVSDPLSRPIQAYYGYLKNTNTAVMEMAAASGITLLTEEEKDPLLTSTYGTGEMILHALNKGCKNFIIGIGGSATNDGGLGMLQALGYRFLDESGREVGRGGQVLSQVHSILKSPLENQLKCCSFQIACDVNNPLYGEKGATYVYGPQKGVSEKTKILLDSAMNHYKNVVIHTIGKDYSQTPGAGAAGGLGFALLSFLRAALTPGVDLILHATELENTLKFADIVVTGEGRLDRQTTMGKAPIGVAALAKKYHKKVIAFAGSVTEDARACNQAGIDAFFPIVRGATTLQEAMDTSTATKNLTLTSEQVFRLL